MFVENDNGVLKHLQKTELMVLKDFIDICEENNLDYYLAFGTLIGAVRHEGFIPWDDDIDVMMFREDFEKFLKIMESKNSDKYEMLEIRYHDDYFLLFSKMSLKNTLFEDFWGEQVSFNVGIDIDIFILDNLPNNKIKCFFYRKYCDIIDKLLTMSAVKLNDNYSIPIRLLSNSMNVILNKLGFKTKYFQKKANKLFRKYEFKPSDYVCDLTVNGQIVFKKDEFEPPKKLKFEDITANVPNNYDSVLKKTFGDYMKIPPKEERITHDLTDINFGDY